MVDHTVTTNAEYTPFLALVHLVVRHSIYLMVSHLILLPSKSVMHLVFHAADFDALKTCSLVYGSLCTGRFTWTSFGVNRGEASSHQVPILKVLKNIDSVFGAKSACRIWLEDLVANLWQCRCRPKRREADHIWHRERHGWNFHPSMVSYSTRQIIPF